MFVIVMILVLCIFPGILSGIIQFSLLKRQEQAGGDAFFRITIAYTALFYGLLSAVKTIFDGAAATLAESFEDAVPLTYLHYLIPLILLACLLPGIVTLAFRKINLLRLFSLFDSFSCLLLLMAWVSVGRISNAVCIAGLSAGAAAALGGGTLFWRREVSFCTWGGIRERIWQVSPAVLFYIVTVILVIPGTLFLNNDAEITFVPSSVVRVLLTGALVWFAVIAGSAVLLLTQRQFTLFCTLLFAVTFAGYLQNMALNGSMSVMDGSRQVWSAAQRWGNLAIWIALITALLLLKGKIHRDVSKVYRWICIYLSLVQLVSLGYLIAVPSANQKDGEEEAEEDYILTTEGALELHPTNNVLVFVLDWYDEQVLEKVLQTDPDFLQPLDGFTYYANATSRYDFTGLSLPYLLTGVEKPEGMMEEQYTDYAFANGHMLEDIAAAGYDVKIYTDMENVSASAARTWDNYQPYKCYCKTWPTMALMLRCSGYQMAPFMFKDRFWYTSDAFDALAYDVGSAKWSAYDDLLLNDALYRTGLSVDRMTDCSGYFKFYHLYGIHPPYYLTEHLQHAPWTEDYDSMLSAARGSMMIVYNYLDFLKKEELYDSAAIIITADHGENYLYDENDEELIKNLQLQYTSTPILMIKNPGQTGAVRKSMAPVSHEEVIASIVKAANPQAAGYGRTVEEVGETEERVRVLTYGRGDTFYDIEITGDAMDPNNWKIAE